MAALEAVVVAEGLTDTPRSSPSVALPKVAKARPLRVRGLARASARLIGLRRDRTSSTAKLTAAVLGPSAPVRGLQGRQSERPALRKDGLPMGLTLPGRTRLDRGASVRKGRCRAGRPAMAGHSLQPVRGQGRRGYGRPPARLLGISGPPATALRFA